MTRGLGLCWFRLPEEHEMPKDFVSVADWSADELWAMVERALELRRNHKTGKRPRTLEGRTLAMYFEKPSL